MYWAAVSGKGSPDKRGLKPAIPSGVWKTTSREGPANAVRLHIRLPDGYVLSCNKPARLNSSCTATQISEKPAWSIGFRARKIMSHPSGRLGSHWLIQARNRRFARLRCTAIPTARPATTPTRACWLSWGAAMNTTSGCAYDLPIRRTRWKSVDRVRRNLRFTHLPAASQRAQLTLNEHLTLACLKH